MAVECLRVGQLATNCYIFYEKREGECFIIDPGDDGDFISTKVGDLSLRPKAILATHGHFDHVLGTTELKLAWNIPLWMSKKDEKILKRAQKTARFFTGVDGDPPPKIDRFLMGREELRLDKLRLKVLSAPGHTPGGLVFYCQQEGLAFVGDVVFAMGGVGRTDLEGGSEEELKKSIAKILRMPDDTVLYPGHGEPSSVGKAKQFFL